MARPHIEEFKHITNPTGAIGNYWMVALSDGTELRFSDIQFASYPGGASRAIRKLVDDYFNGKRVPTMSWSAPDGSVGSVVTQSLNNQRAMLDKVMGPEVVGPHVHYDHQTASWVTKQQTRGAEIAW